MFSNISPLSNSKGQVDGKPQHLFLELSPSSRSSSEPPSAAEGGIMQPKENKWLVLRDPLQPPVIDPYLEKLNAVVRSTDCLRHFVLSIEFWISPGGRLRQWIKLNICLAAFLLIPAIVVMPIISIVLHEVDGCLAMLARIAWKLIVLSILISVAVMAIQHFPSSSKGSSRRRK